MVVLVWIRLYNFYLVEDITIAKNFAEKKINRFRHIMTWIWIL